MGGQGKGLAVASLLAGATLWGLIWYPYRLLEAAGMGGVLSSLLTYGVGLLVGILILGRRIDRQRLSPWLIAVGLAGAVCNTAYVLAVLHGEIMRVMLLFYLSPLWTVFFARILLGERLTVLGSGVIGLSLAGAVAMLWHPEAGWPLPRSAAEWLGLFAGLMFALSNVLIRRTHELQIEAKTLSVFVGVMVVGMLAYGFELPARPVQLDGGTVGTVIGIGLVLIVLNLIVQFGVSRLRATHAIVIMLFELVVAGLSSWWLAGETMGAKEWLGGGLIVAASLFSGVLEEAPPDDGKAA